MEGENAPNPIKTTISSSKTSNTHQAQNIATQKHILFFFLKMKGVF